MPAKIPTPDHVRVYLAGRSCLVVRNETGAGGFAAASACVLAVPGSPYNAWPTAVLDSDGDGYGDIAEGYSATELHIWRSTGSALSALLTVPLATNVRALGTLDRNRDGVGELAVLGLGWVDRVRIFVPAGSSYRVVCQDVGIPLTADTGGMQGLIAFVGDVDEDGIPAALEIHAVPIHPNRVGRVRHEAGSTNGEMRGAGCGGCRALYLSARGRVARDAWSSQPRTRTGGGVALPGGR